MNYKAFPEEHYISRAIDVRIQNADFELKVLSVMKMLETALAFPDDMKNNRDSWIQGAIILLNSVQKAADGSSKKD